MAEPNLEMSIRLLEMLMEDGGRFNLEIIRIFAIGVKSEASAIADEKTKQRIDLELRSLEARANKNYDEVERLWEDLKKLRE